MQMQLLKKVEELTLYVIQLNDVTEQQQSIINKLNNELAEIKSKQE